MSTGEAVVFVADENGQAPPVEEAVSAVLDEASLMGASDLFLASTEDGLDISVRHLGVVRSLRTVTNEDGRRWLARIKILSNIPIDNRRRPNEGRWLHERSDGHKLDIRVATIPTLHGEDFALRLLERDSTLQRLDGLGLDRQGLQSLTAMLHAPGGLILVTGPTSSGKTTTLYACLHYLNDGTRKINTIEDPIEYAVEGIRQSQVNPAIDVDFPELLRSVLRQAPDVIMIGEIRDAVTAQTAVRTANSGHLVLATLHAPTASGAVQSMLNLGVHPHFFASSLRGVLAQRLRAHALPAVSRGLRSERSAADVRGRQALARRRSRPPTLHRQRLRLVQENRIRRPHRRVRGVECHTHFAPPYQRERGLKDSRTTCRRRWHDRISSGWATQDRSGDHEHRRSRAHCARRISRPCIVGTLRKPRNQELLFLHTLLP